MTELKAVTTHTVERLWQQTQQSGQQSLVSDTKHVNTTIAQAYINNQGQHVTITDAELYLTFLTERAGYLTSIGYYYYKTNDVPNSPDKVDKFIIIPNASIAGGRPIYRTR